MLVPLLVRTSRTTLWWYMPPAGVPRYSWGSPRSTCSVAILACAATQLAWASSFVMSSSVETANGAHGSLTSGPRADWLPMSVVYNVRWSEDREVT